MPAKTLPPVEYLRECFDYDPATGELRWKARPQGQGRGGRQIAAGTLAGGINHDGYVRVRVKGSKYFAHRIIWKMETGEEPPLEIDHKHGSPANNRMDNLRAATRVEQVWNSGPRKDNTSGRRGVYASGKKWKAELGNQYLGKFDSIEEASQAYETAARAQRGEYYRGV